MNLRRPDGSYDALRVIARQMRDRFAVAQAYSAEWSADDWRATEWQVLGTELASQLTLIRDRRLRASASELLDLWNDAMVSAPPRLVGMVEERLIWSFDETDHARGLREVRHHKCVREGLALATAILEHLDRLEARTTTSLR